MKSLTESILSSTNSGTHSDYLVYEKEYKIIKRLFELMDKYILRTSSDSITYVWRDDKYDVNRDKVCNVSYKSSASVSRIFDTIASEMDFDRSEGFTLKKSTNAIVINTPHSTRYFIQCLRGSVHAIFFRISGTLYDKHQNELDDMLNRYKVF